MDSSFGDNVDATTHLARAELLFDLDRFVEAREELGGALSSDPAHVPSLTLLAILELQVGNNEEALAAAEAALAAEPTHEAAVLARAHALAMLHRVEAALRAADDIQQRYPESWWHNVHYALVVRETRNGQDALDAAWAAVRLAPEEARAHLALAVVAATLGLDDLADRALSAAARFDPESHRLLDGELGLNLLRSGPRPGRNRGRTPEPTWERAGGTERAPRPPLPQVLMRSLRLAGVIGIMVPLIAALTSGGTADGARLFGGIAAAAGIIALVVMVRRLPVDVQDGLRVTLEQDRSFAVAATAAACGPLLTAVFALTGWVYLLAIAVLAGMLAVGMALTRR